MTESSFDNAESLAQSIVVAVQEQRALRALARVATREELAASEKAQAANEALAEATSKLWKLIEGWEK